MMLERLNEGEWGYGILVGDVYKSSERAERRGLINVYFIVMDNFLIVLFFSQEDLVHIYGVSEEWNGDYRLILP